MLSSMLVASGLEVKNSLGRDSALDSGTLLGTATEAGTAVAIGAGPIGVTVGSNIGISDILFKLGVKSFVVEFDIGISFLPQDQPHDQEIDQ